MRLVLSAVLTITALPLLAAEVYRSVEADGTVVYSDRPGENTERVFVATPGTASSSRAPTAASAPAPVERAAPQSDELGAEVRVEPTPQELAAERARNCSIAEERAQRYSVSQRLFRTLPNGEREYLSDAELDEARARAEADVANWCG